jgi:hypothetical protein
MTVSNFSVAITNWASSNVVEPLFVTNRDAGVVLINTGEGPARNVTASIQAFLPGETGQSQVRRYHVPEIGTNRMATLPFNDILFSASTNVNVFGVKWSDDRGLATAETNMTVHVR